jgi:hypothetical protein
MEAVGSSFVSGVFRNSEITAEINYPAWRGHKLPRAWLGVGRERGREREMVSEVGQELVIRSFGEVLLKTTLMGCCP